jgi:hypothetical protein
MIEIISIINTVLEDFRIYGRGRRREVGMVTIKYPYMQVYEHDVRIIQTLLSWARMIGQKKKKKRERLRYAD